MTPNRVYIFGASGSGTTTLGAEVAGARSLRHVDCDDHYWAPVDPPFSKKRPPSKRLMSMQAALGDGGWVISGSCQRWGAELIQSATLHVFVTLPTELRMARLRARENLRFGDRIKTGGDMADIHKGFLAWAAEYDDPNFAGRNRAQHESWIEKQKTPLCRVDGRQPLATSVAQVLARMD